MYSKFQRHHSAQPIPWGTPRDRTLSANVKTIFKQVNDYMFLRDYCTRIQTTLIFTNFEVLQETSNKNTIYVKWNRDLEIKYRAILRTQFWHLER